MAQFQNLYQRAFYYDIVFHRDVTPEIDFIAEVYRQCVGENPRSLVDLACGPGYHARAATRRGLRAVGLDLHQEMVAFAAERATQEGLNIEWIAADMRAMRLHDPVDIALNAFDGIDCLLTTHDLVAHFRAIADNLTPRGLYFIDVTHPRMSTFYHYGDFHYTGSLNGTSVRVNWAVNNPQIDPLTGISHTEIEIRIQENGGETVIIDQADERVFTAQEITLLSELSGALQPVRWYGAYDTNVSLDSPHAERMIAVLQKTS